MAADVLRARLNAHIASMYAEGVVDGETFQELREAGTAAEIASFFIDDANEILEDMDTLMRQPQVDLDEVEDLVQQLIECSSSVGAQHVRLACTHFSNICAIKCKEVCIMALTLVKSEFCILRNEFKIMMQLEERIAACGPNS